MERLLLPNTTPSAPTSTTLPLWLLFAVAAASSSSLLLPLYFELDTSAFTLLLCISSTTTSVCLTRTLQVTASWLRCCSNDSDLGLTIRSFLSRRGRTVHRILPLCWSIQPNVLSIMNLVTCCAALRSVLIIAVQLALLCLNNEVCRRPCSLMSVSWLGQLPARTSDFRMRSALVSCCRVVCGSAALFLVLSRLNA